MNPLVLVSLQGSNFDCLVLESKMLPLIYLYLLDVVNSPTSFLFVTIGTFLLGGTDKDWILTFYGYSNSLVYFVGLKI